MHKWSAGGRQKGGGVEISRKCTENGQREGGEERKKSAVVLFFSHVKCVKLTGKIWQTKYGYQSECEHSSEQCDMQGSWLDVEK